MEEQNEKDRVLLKKSGIGKSATTQKTLLDKLRGEGEDVEPDDVLKPGFKGVMWLKSGGRKRGVDAIRPWFIQILIIKNRIRH